MTLLIIKERILERGYLKMRNEIYTHNVQDSAILRPQKRIAITNSQLTYLLIYGPLLQVTLSCDISMPALILKRIFPLLKNWIFDHSFKR